MKRFEVDLHVHTALSPCAANEMTPCAIVTQALRQGLDMIAVCDHNACGNAMATQEAAAGRLTVLAGVEITTSEEVHMLGIFPDSGSAGKACSAVRASLPDAEAEDARTFGEQLLMDAHGNVTGVDPKLLSSASRLTLAEAVSVIRSNRGIVVLSHVDRPAFSVFGQLGMIPEGTDADALELSAAGVEAGVAPRFKAFGLPLLTGSDSHFLSQLGAGRTSVEMHGASFDEMVAALKGVSGRRILDA